MAEKNEESKGAARELVDTKFGVIDAGSIEMKTGKNDKEFATAKLKTAGGKEVTLYAHGKMVDKIKEVAAAGVPTLVVGDLLAKGAGLSVSSFAAKTYSMAVESIGKTGSNEYGPWATAKLKAEGKNKAWNVLLTGDDVKKAQDNVGKTAEFDIVWTAHKFNDNSWGSSPVSADSLLREMEAAPKAEEPAGPGM